MSLEQIEPLICFVCGRPKIPITIKDDKNRKITYGIKCGCGITVLK